MSKQLKINIKNAQLAQAVDLGDLKGKLPKSTEEKKKKAVGSKAKDKSSTDNETVEENAGEAPPAVRRRVKARSKSAFAPGTSEEEAEKLQEALLNTSENEPSEKESLEDACEEVGKDERKGRRRVNERVAAAERFDQLFAERDEADKATVETEDLASHPVEEVSKFQEEEIPSEEPKAEISKEEKEEAEVNAGDLTPPVQNVSLAEPEVSEPESSEPISSTTLEPITIQQKITIPRERRKAHSPALPSKPQGEKLGPTGRHIRDVLPGKSPSKPRPDNEVKAEPSSKDQAPQREREQKDRPQDVKGHHKGKHAADQQASKVLKGRGQRFDSRDRQGLRSSEDQPSGGWKKRGHRAQKKKIEIPVVRPSELKIRLPITIKDLAAEMKLKASEIIQKLFLQGVVLTINDYLDDELTVQLLGEEFKCAIEIDSSERDRIQITQQSVEEEIREAQNAVNRPPVVAFMGHVDHGKTSLIDYIRKSNRAADEAGAITQHIGAFQCETPVGKITFLDTPGHEAFSAMRARGADVTDIVVLVVAGDEGVKMQTIEAIQHARAAGVTVVVAINKCDKPHFNAENVFRQLAENNLLPEAWGGDILTINCSAVTGEGVEQLLEMLALQAEVLELKAIPSMRARGRVIESELNKGMGVTSTVLVQNGTLKSGDALVFDHHWGRVKTMTDATGTQLTEAGPSAAVEITGLSGLPGAGEEFIVVENEKEARSIAEARMTEARETHMRHKRMRGDNIFQMSAEGEKKVLNIILRGDVQGSVEALKSSLERIASDKAELNVIFSGVGEVTESDVQLAVASNAVIIGFHVQIESHANQLIKETGIQVFLYDVIYRAVDEVKKMMEGLLEKVASEESRGTANVLAVFRSSQLGNIAGCMVESGSINRNYSMRVIREGECIWQGAIRSIKRLKEDVKEVKKGFECGILLDGFNEVKEGDVLEAFEIVYTSQEL